MSTIIDQGAPTGASRRPWLAALLAFCLGPFGLLYTSILGALVTFGLALPLLGTIRAQPLVGLGFAALYALFAFLLTSRARTRSSRPARFDRPTWPKALLTLAVMLGLFYAFTTSIQGYVDWRGTSMLPTVREGQPVTVTIHPALRGPIERGTLVLFRAPGQRPKWRFMARVVGLTGDRVTLRGGVVYVNDQVSDDPARLAVLKEAGCLNATSEENNTASLGVTKGQGTTVQVPDGHLFVVADNRADNYLDSRGLGPLPIVNVIGVVRSPQRDLAPLTPEDCKPRQPF